MGRWRFGGLILAIVAGAVSVVAAAGGPKKAVSATITFRCTAGEGGPACVTPITDSTDRVRDDAQVYDGGSVSPDGVFFVAKSPTTGRLLNLTLAFPVDTPGCIAIGNCNPTGPHQDETLFLNNFDVKVKPLTTDGSADLAGGLYAMGSCGAIHPGLVHFTFFLPDGDGHWGLNFNPKAYVGTTAADLIRVSTATWTVETKFDDIAELLSWARSGIVHRNGPSREGKFIVPFKATITLPGGLPAGAGSCS